MFSSEGSNLTPAHHFPDFRLKTYAPLAFRYFRELFGIKPDDYLVSVNIHIISLIQHNEAEVSVDLIATLALTKTCFTTLNFSTLCVMSL